MTNKEQLRILIEQYFEGNLSEKDIAELNKGLINDPELKAEFDLQNEIVRGIKNYRKVELKSRLESVKVPTGLIGSLASSNVILGSLISGVVVIGTIIGITIFPKSSNENLELISLNGATYTLPLEKDVPAIPEPRSTVDATISNTKIHSDAPENIEDDVKDKQGKAPYRIKKRQLSVLLPDVPEQLSQEQNPDIEEINQKPRAITGFVDNEVEQISIATISDDQFDFHYKFYDSQLFLYGNYDEQYEILELFSVSDKQLYFIYKGAYYVIKNNTRTPVPFTEITDETLIKELEVVKEK